MSLLDKYDQVAQRHDSLVAAGRDPFDICMDRIISATEAIVDGREIILVGTNNYLGLTFEPGSIEAAVSAIKREGTGTTGSRIANGTYSSHRALEREIADFLGRRSATPLVSRGPGGRLGGRRPRLRTRRAVRLAPSGSRLPGRLRAGRYTGRFIWV